MFPLLVCSPMGPSDASLPSSCTKSPNKKILYFSSPTKLVSCLAGILSCEHNLSFPIVILIDLPPVPGNSSKLPNDIDKLSFIQLKSFISMIFSTLNLIILDQTSNPDIDTIFETTILTSHEFFLKNHFKRMKSWIGINDSINDLSLTIFEEISKSETFSINKELVCQLSSLNETKTYNHFSYPILPPFIISMPKTLAEFLNYNHNFSKDTGVPPISSILENVNILDKNVDFYSLLNITNQRKFFIKEFLVESWNFPAHTLSYDELIYVTFLIFKRAFNLFTEDQSLTLNDNQLLMLIFKVRDVYNGSNDFHNFRHAVDVVQAIFYYLLKLNLIAKEGIISKKIIVHNYKREKKFSSEQNNTKDGNLTWEKVIENNEQNIDNNDLLDKESEELDPEIEYHIYCQSPKLYLNQLRTYQNVLDENFPFEICTKPDTVIETEYGEFLQCEKSQLLQPIEVLSLLIAALGHDSGHPGLTNNFINSNKSPLSIIFNEQSILENYHFIVFHEILLSYWPQLFDKKIVEKVSGNSAIDIKRVIMKSILATDMEKHFAFIDEIKNRERDASEKKNSDNKYPKLELSGELICQLLLKCADISNITRPLRLSATWGVTLGKEMKEITLLEKMIGKIHDLNSNPSSCLSNNENKNELLDLIKLYEDSEADKIKMKQVFEHLENYSDLKFDRTNKEIKNMTSQISTTTLSSLDTAHSSSITILDNQIDSSSSFLKELISNNPQLAKNQIFFIEQISYKLFAKINNILPWLAFILRILNKNLSFWKLYAQGKNLD